MKFVNFVKYAGLGRIAGARAAHFEYADRLREEGKLANALASSEVFEWDIRGANPDLLVPTAEADHVRSH